MTLGLFLAGCSPGSHDDYTLGEWLKDLQEQSGIDENGTMPAMQALKQYGIIEQESIDEEMPLNREWAAYTLINLSGAEFSEAEVKDIDRTQFPRHVETAVNEGLFHLDGGKKFHPEKKVKEKEAMKLLGSTVVQINNESFETAEKVEAAEDAPLYHAESLSYDLSANTCILPSGTDLSAYKGITWVDETGQEQIFDIASHKETEAGLEVQLEEADLLSYTDSMEFQGESGLDFDNAEIITGDTSASFSQDDPFAHTMSNYNMKKFSIKGYAITLKTTATSISADLEKQLDSGLKLKGKLKLSGINVRYRFFTLKKNVDNAYFKVDLHTEESLAVTGGAYKKLYGDFSSLDPKNFLPSLQNFLKPKSEMPAAEFEICRLRIPLEATTAVTVLAKLSVNLYASGKASFVLSQDNDVGIEIRHGVPRFIHDYSHSQTNSIKADTGITGQLTFGLEALRVSLMDIGIESGVKAAIATSVHLVDEEGKMEKTATDLPADAVSELSSGNPDVLVCTDMNAYVLLNLILNSSGTMLGRAGLSGRLKLLDQSSGSLFGGTKHFENWHQVSQCTRKAHKKGPSISAVPTGDTIRLSSYAVAIRQGSSRQIRVTGIPKGYSSKDLVYHSSGSCASVSSSGLVTGNTAGSAVITIETKDGRYRIECSVLVTEGKGT